MSTNPGISEHSLPDHLAKDRQIHVIISVLSGTQQAQPYYDSTLAPFLAKHNIQHTTHTTKSTQTIIELVQDVFLPQAQEGHHQTIILLSGDGGLIDIVNTVAINLPEELTQKSTTNYIKPVICLFPHGTGNALAWSSKIADNPIQVIETGRAKPLPLFHVTFSPGTKLVVNEGTDLETITTTATTDPNGNSNPHIYGAVVFSWGLHASLVARSDTKEYRKHGLERFRMVASTLLQENHAYQGSIAIQAVGSKAWQTLSQSTPSASPDQSEPEPKPESEPGAEPKPNHNQQGLSYLAATVVSNLEQNYTISPSHKPLYNEMHVIYIPHRPATEIGELTFLPYKQGQHVHDPRVTYLAIDALRVEVDEPDDEWREFCVDGKIVRVPNGGWAQISRLDGVSVVDVVAPDS